MSPESALHTHCVFLARLPYSAYTGMSVVRSSSICKHSSHQHAVSLSLLLCGLQAWLYFILLVYNYWVQIRHVPYYHTWINCVFAFSSCTYAWGAFLLLIATYMRNHWDRFTIAFYCGAVLSIASVGLVGIRYALLCMRSLLLVKLI